MNQIRNEFYTAALISVLYFVVNVVYISYLAPANDRLSPNDIIFSQLFYLPQGILIITTWLYRAKAIAYLLIAGFLTTILQPPTPINILISSNMIIACIIPYMVFELFKACGLDMYLMPGIEYKKQWRSVMLIALVCAIFNALSQALTSMIAGGFENAIVLISREVIGGTTGILACLLCLYLYAKVITLYSFRNE